MEPAVTLLTSVLHQLVDDATDVGVAASGYHPPLDHVSSAQWLHVREMVSEMLQAGRFSGAVASTARHSERFMACVLHIRDRVRALQPGQYMVLDGGWKTPRGGHALFYVIECTDSTADDSTADGESQHCPCSDEGACSCRRFTFVVCNSGEGLSYHSVSMGSYPKVCYGSPCGGGSGLTLLLPWIFVGTPGEVQPKLACWRHSVAPNRQRVILAGAATNECFPPPAACSGGAVRSAAPVFVWRTGRAQCGCQDDPATFGNTATLRHMLLPLVTGCCAVLVVSQRDVCCRSEAGTCTTAAPAAPTRLTLGAVDSFSGVLRPAGSVS